MAERWLGRRSREIRGREGMDGYTRLLEMMSGLVGVLQEQLKEDFDYPEIDKILRILEQTAGELEKAARMTVGLERRKREREGKRE